MFPIRQDGHAEKDLQCTQTSRLADLKKEAYLRKFINAVKKMIFFFGIF